MVGVKLSGGLELETLITNALLKLQSANNARWPIAHTNAAPQSQVETDSEHQK